MKCEKARRIIAIYAEHLCKGDNCANTITCEMCSYSGFSALTELDAMEKRIEELETILKLYKDGVSILNKTLDEIQALKGGE
jgi:hypothetical protein